MNTIRYRFESWRESWSCILSLPIFPVQDILQQGWVVMPVKRTVSIGLYSTSLGFIWHLLVIRWVHSPRYSCLLSF
ncbi:hypothetical protein SERLA73DRAFT_171918 [Serpula lacrymans var. lacrymans S7.3]|uniref:Uncharacterized protein n=1 Tax=Serpula lacrymans var. lacrymans (strain S7.3) TaxID=936435 RepID=F8QDA8_SERL3|nr:hypothetical protein SERLA73DRAFT_171918 [Serpula lacrymans var. lacrymans S7.3]